MADVGATIYLGAGGDWEGWEAWNEHIAPDWAGMHADELDALLEDVSGLQLQEPEKQGRYKLSYYAPLDADFRALMGRADERLRRASVRANLIGRVIPWPGWGCGTCCPPGPGCVRPSVSS